MPPNARTEIAVADDDLHSNLEIDRVMTFSESTHLSVIVGAKGSKRSYDRSKNRNWCEVDAKSDATAIRMAVA